MKRWTHQPKVGDVIDPLGKWVLYDDMERHAASEYARGYANGSGDEGRYQREIERLRAAQQHMYVEGKRFEGLWRDAAQENEKLRALLRQWQFDVGGASERLEHETLAVINGVPQTPPIDTVSGNGYSTVHGKDESGTAPVAPREARETGPKEV